MSMKLWMRSTNEVNVCRIPWEHYSLGCGCLEYRISFKVLSVHLQSIYYPWSSGNASVSLLQTPARDCIHLQSFSDAGDKSTDITKCDSCRINHVLIEFVMPSLDIIVAVTSSLESDHRAGAGACEPLRILIITSSDLEVVEPAIIRTVHRFVREYLELVNIVH